ncbi:MAG TPA: CGNR zinc finger domain-containing protein [Candidatus Acidoferrum sp.]|nr:CGNR zinc finger domain-containing protein [Candidatus Acidoferrum sp.]
MQVREPLPIALVNGDDPRLTDVGPVELGRLREACRAVLAAHVEGRATTRELAPLNRLIDAHLSARYTLVSAQGRVGSARMSTAPDAPSLLLSDICLAIVELFAGAKGARIKHCANPQCERFFLDESKSGTRAWCSMKTCGNRMKAARYYERTKS